MGEAAVDAEAVDAADVEWVWRSGEARSPNLGAFSEIPPNKNRNVQYIAGP
jgi:hypothetical protein